LVTAGFDLAEGGSFTSWVVPLLSRLGLLAASKEAPLGIPVAARLLSGGVALVLAGVFVAHPRASAQRSGPEPAKGGARGEVVLGRAPALTGPAAAAAALVSWLPRSSSRATVSEEAAGAEEARLASEWKKHHCLSAVPFSLVLCADAKQEETAAVPDFPPRGSPSDCPLPLSRRSLITVLASALYARNQISCLLLRSHFHPPFFSGFLSPSKCSLGFGRGGVHAIACRFSQTGRTDCFGSTSRSWMVANKCPLPDKLCFPPNFSGCLMSDD
jgi:hypothetical protein